MPRVKHYFKGYRKDNVPFPSLKLKADNVQTPEQTCEGLLTIAGAFALILERTLRACERLATTVMIDDFMMFFSLSVLAVCRLVEIHITRLIIYVNTYFWLFLKFFIFVATDS